MKIQRRIIALTACVALTFLTACAEKKADNQVPEGATVHLSADYPSYGSNDLVRRSSVIVEGTVLSTKSTVILPRFEEESASPNNPLYGLSEEEKAKVKAEAEKHPVPATEVSVRVESVRKGDVKAGQIITIVQTGGVLDGVTYVVDEEKPLAPGKRYLLFGTDSFDGKFVILGGSAGTYIRSGEDSFASVDPRRAPFATVNNESVEELIRETK